jgi:hypothetical protein
MDNPDEPQLSDSVQNVPAVSVWGLTVPGWATSLSHGFEADSAPRIPNGFQEHSTSARTFTTGEHERTGAQPGDAGNRVMRRGRPDTSPANWYVCSYGRTIACDLGNR